MSSEEEAAAANVLSQMSQIQQPQAQGDSVQEAVISVAHHCDIETTATITSLAQMTDVEVVDIVQVLPTQTYTDPASEITKPVEATTTVMTEPPKIDNPKISAGGKVYQCEYCGKLFNKSYNLKTHIRVHTGERPYQCEVCGHGFANFGDLKRHSRTHTGEKPFQCEYCGKVFSDFGSHKRHLRLHTGYRPFKCEQCGREFTRLDSFKNHSRLHTGARPYKCEQCLKEFNYLTTYKRHLNIHKGEKPYPCSKCPKKFTRLSYLRNHLMIHECKEDNLDGENMKDDHEEDTTSNLSNAETDATMTEHVQTEDCINSTSSESEVTKTTIEDESTNTNEDQSAEHNNRKCSETLLQQVNDLLAGGDQDGGHVGDGQTTLTQQFILAQQILSQATLDQHVTVTTTDDSSEDDKLDNNLIVTTSAGDSLSPHMLAQQIMSQAQMPTVIETATGQHILIQTSQTQDDKGDIGSQLLISHPDGQNMGSEEVVMSEVLENGIQVAVTSHGMVRPDTEAVYVAIDPSRPEVQQLLQQIAMSTHQ